MNSLQRTSNYFHLHAFVQIRMRIIWHAHWSWQGPERRNLSSSGIASGLWPLPTMSTTPMVLSTGNFCFDAKADKAIP